MRNKLFQKLSSFVDDEESWRNYLFYTRGLDFHNITTTNQSKAVSSIFIPFHHLYYFWDEMNSTYIHTYMHILFTTGYKKWRRRFFLASFQIIHNHHRFDRANGWNVSDSLSVRLISIFTLHSPHLSSFVMNSSSYVLYNHLIWFLLWLFFLLETKNVFGIFKSKLLLYSCSLILCEFLRHLNDHLKGLLVILQKGNCSCY